MDIQYRFACGLAAILGSGLTLAIQNQNKSTAYQVYEGDKYYLAECRQNGMQSTPWIKKVYYNNVTDDYTYISMPVPTGSGHSISIDYGNEECKILKF